MGRGNAAGVVDGGGLRLRGPKRGDSCAPGHLGKGWIWERSDKAGGCGRAPGGVLEQLSWLGASRCSQRVGGARAVVVAVPVPSRCRTWVEDPGDDLGVFDAGNHPELAAAHRQVSMSMANTRFSRCVQVNGSEGFVRVAPRRGCVLVRRTCGACSSGRIRRGNG